MFRLLTAVAVLALAAPLHATTIHVPDDQSTIQAGIDAAEPSDTVSIAPGTYTWDSEGTGFLHPIWGWTMLQMAWSVTLRSANGDPASVIIDAQQRGRVMIFNDEEATAVIEGITFTGGFVPDSDMTSGAGLLCQTTSPWIIRCRFTSNESRNSGGGLFCYFRSSPHLIDCTFSGNQASYGGALACTDYSSPTIQACLFMDNQAQNDGGAITTFWESIPVITFCTFIRNSAGGEAGALLCGDHCNSPIVSCTFVENSASSAGGIFCYTSPSPSIRNTILWGNTPDQINGGNVTCSDVMGGCPGEGNIDANPQFCDPDYEDYRVDYDSPCAPPNNNCEVLMGAWPVGCSTVVESKSWGQVKALY